MIELEVTDFIADILGIIVDMNAMGSIYIAKAQGHLLPPWSTYCAVRHMHATWE
jgi:hypothetical protein